MTLSDYDISPLAGDDFTEPFNDDIPDFVKKEFFDDQHSNLSAKDKLIIKIEKIITEIDLCKTRAARARYGLWRATNPYYWKDWEQRKLVLDKLNKMRYTAAARLRELTEQLNNL